MIPYGSLAVASGEEATRLVIGGAEGALVSVLAGALRRANDRLRTEARERELAQDSLRRATEEMVHAQKMRAIGDFRGGDRARLQQHAVGVMVARASSCSSAASLPTLPVATCSRSCARSSSGLPPWPAS